MKKESLELLPDDSQLTIVRCQIREDYPTAYESSGVWHMTKNISLIPRLPDCTPHLQKICRYFHGNMIKCETAVEMI